MTTNHTHHDDDHKACLALFEKLSEYIDGETDEVTCKAIRAHIEACPCCTTCLETLKRTIGFCEEVKEVPVPAGFSQKLREALKKMPPALSS
ncbi:anti-sigma factor [Desulfoluna sp.]|uniref:anti-sigma factor family protein n=1 Tax=Desulfoluna sp. TaxID=2045199 RepID=UPI002635FBB6|nr:zf-HC2 domain-containing protein [Desulfoluna sp.]